MLDILNEGFKQATDKLKGKATLTEENISPAMEEVRRSLLEADVEYTVAKKFLQRVQEKAVGQDVQLKAGSRANRVKVSAGDHFVQICQEELEALMGPADASLQFPENRPTIIMMVGLQGSGKTTTTGKLANYLIKTHKRKPLLVAADIYRPAAIEQLKVLGQRINVPVYHEGQQDPVTIAKNAVRKAYELNVDTIILDTAGRLTIDTALMQELRDIKQQLKPDNILLVCDAMMGQDAVTTAKAFDEQLDLSGIVITKLDGDARGGAALSIKEVTGKPIKFLGMGEDLDRLEEFRPEGLASRILGMGDIVGLMQDFEKVSDKDREEEALRMMQGQFTLNDFYDQLSMIQKMGSLKDIVAKLPMQNMIPKDVNLDDRELVKVKAMIDSMTADERANPKLFNDSRLNRVARGSGRSTRDVSELLKKFMSMRQMMGMVGKNMGLLGKIPGFNQMSQLANLRKMGNLAGGGGGGMDSLMAGMGGAGMPGMPPGMGGMFGGAAGAKKAVDKDKLRKQRKAAKNARKKNRKR